MILSFQIDQAIPTDAELEQTDIIHDDQAYPLSISIDNWADLYRILLRIGRLMVSRIYRKIFG